MRISYIQQGLAALIMMGALAAGASADSPEATTGDTLQPKQVLGWLLNIRVYPDGLLMRAKLDSGARSSAMHAEDIEVFEDDDGRQMVRFVVLDEHDDPDSDAMSLVLPLEREVNIKLRYTDDADARPVVKMEFCMAGKRHTALLSLTDRSNFNYPVLLGREFLKTAYLIDPSESFTHRTGCPRG
ncbi:MAG TPA: hypothetical protein GX696_07390 [Pseudomonadaceae bacterium]|nr:hypothetical protein [Pseudomonadaceae bacterium]